MKIKMYYNVGQVNEIFVNEYSQVLIARQLLLYGLPRDMYNL